MPSSAAKAASIVLVTLATGQFVMALDTTVMNTAIATVAEDLGTTVTGIQTAITFYTLVMASLMITGGKVGQIIGRSVHSRSVAHSTPWVAHDRAVPEPDDADHRLVVPPGPRCGADHAGDRGARRHELRTVRNGRVPTISSPPPARSRRARWGR